MTYTCTICRAVGSTTAQKAPCHHGYKFQQMGQLDRQKRKKSGL